MRSAFFRGRDHLHLGAVDTVTEGPAAIAISLGGRSKSYAYTDPNEDAALFAFGAGVSLVAVADGHSGFESSEIALAHLLSHPAPQWLSGAPLRPAAWTRQALAVLCDVNDRILREIGNGDPRGGSETTLSFALIATELDLLLYASVGDSHLFQVGEKGAEEHNLGAADERPYFLGREPATPEALHERCHLGVAPLAGTRAVVLATDGLSAPHVGVADPAAAVQAAVETATQAPAELRARGAARGVVETALAAQRNNPSGDNAACAVVWVEEQRLASERGEH